jgi:pimeloyl-ACP methyl ester carboxylesterase
VEIAYEELGAGLPPVVWGHGLTSSRAAEDRNQLVDFTALTVLTSVLRYDARGHGESQLSSDLAGYGWAEMARDQLALTDHLGYAQYIACGASLGAATALHAIATAPERIVGLVLVIPPTAWDTRSAQVDLYESMAALVERRGADALARAAAALPPPDPLLGREDWRDGRLRTLRAADPVRLATVFKGAATADLPSREQIAAIGVPALVLTWSGDTGHPVSTARELGDLIPHAQVSVASTYDEFASWTDRICEFVGALTTG